MSGIKCELKCAECCRVMCSGDKTLVNSEELIANSGEGETLNAQR